MFNVIIFFFEYSHLISRKIFVQPTDEMTPTCTLRKVFWFFVTFFASYAKQDPFDSYFLLNLRPSCILISDSLEKVNNGLHNGAKLILKSHEPLLISQHAISQKQNYSSKWLDLKLEIFFLLTILIRLYHLYPDFLRLHYAKSFECKW